MIMRPGQPLLLPANPLFIWFSLIVAMTAMMLPVGRLPWMPDILAVVLVFWSVHQPLRIGVIAAFLFGLAVDVHQASLLGQHALAYTTLSYFAITMHRRLLWFTVPSQAIQVLPLFVAAHAIELAIRMLAGGAFPGPTVLLAPVLEAALWPIVSILLLLPQRRAHDPDENRPL
ncbi:MAG TPA: rod shape-determining protein MreD [Ramlibacter sp.]